LPPQTAFATAPYSIYRKGSFKRAPSRFSYAVTQATTGQKPQIVCFSEEGQRDGMIDTVKHSYKLDDAADNVVTIESIPINELKSTKCASHDILVIFESGRVCCLSSDLEITRWDSTLGKHDLDSGIAVEYAALTTAKSAVSGILRSRQDVAPGLDPKLEETADILDLTPVLCMIRRTSLQKRTLAIYQLQPRSPDIITLQTPLKHLLTWDLPQPTATGVLETAKRVYHLHPTSGVLHELASGHLISYDFSTTIPKIYSELHIPESDTKSFLRVSADLVFTTSRQAWGMFDVRYASLQARLPIEDSKGLSNESKKRKHAEQEPLQRSDDTPVLVSYFADLRVVVAINNHEIIGLQLGQEIPRKRVKSSGSLLIDSIGKGAPSNHSWRANAALVKDSPQWQEWQKKSHKLDKYASKGKVADFERLIGNELKIGSALSKTVNIESSILENGTTNSLSTSDAQDGVSASEAALGKTGSASSSGDDLVKWQLPTVIPISQRVSYRHVALYALCKIFHLKDPESELGQGPANILKAELFPPNVFQWLLASGNITKESIGRAIMESSTGSSDAMPPIADGDIIQAIADFDPELHILAAVLNSQHFLPVGEVVQAVKILVQSMDDPLKDSRISGLLTNGTTSEDDHMDAELASEFDAADHELNRAQWILANGDFIRSQVLPTALTRLHTFSTTVISTTLRSMLRRSDLESLIQILHSELRNGGWTSTYLGSEIQQTEDDVEYDNQAVAIIASLLSCSIDAIGVSTWLTGVGGSPTNTVEDIIVDLQLDADDALNGFWEARYIRGLLGEFLQYTSNIEKTHRPKNEVLQQQRKPFSADATEDDALPMLPLGGKIDLGIEKLKLGKGGRKEERSKREMGMLISKRVPKYSFERIVI
jgi:hypothetical protein